MRTGEKQNKGVIVSFMTYLSFVIYITLLSRNAMLTCKIRTIPLWSYAIWIEGNREQGCSLVLNIGLFVPLGYLLTGVMSRKRRGWKSIVPHVLLCLLISAVIEGIQYFTHLGTCDCDDLINNTLGGIIGVLLYRVIGEMRVKAFLTILFLVAGFIGCMIASGFKNVSEDTYLRQFDFDVNNVAYDNNSLTFHGFCVAYNRETPEYQITLRSIGSGTEYLVDTRIDGDEFTVSMVIDPNEKYEVIVQFKGFKPMTTATYINGSKVEYVAEKIPDPEFDKTDLEGLLQNGFLKAYNVKNDVYVYQVEGKLYWLIGTGFEDDITALYHLQTNEPEKLPESRKIYGFDNMDFRASFGNELTGNMSCGKYRVFETDIPDEYLVTAISVGFSRNKIIDWIEYFRPCRW